MVDEMASPISARTARTWAETVAWGLALAALGGLALVIPHVTVSWGEARAFPFQLDAEEGFILHGAVTLAQGGSIYRPLTSLPYLVGNYPPLFYWVYGLINGPRVTLESMGTGRALAQGAALWTALALAAIAALRTRRALPALLGGLLFFCSYEVGHWAEFARVDLPALALTVTGLGIFLAVRGRWGAVTAAVVLAAAGYTRQTALLAPAAIVIGCALEDRRRFWWFLIPYAGLGLGALVITEAATGGEFLRHVVSYNRNVMDWGAWRRVMKNEVWFFYRWWILGMAWGAGGILWASWKIWNKKSEDRSQESEPPHSMILHIYMILAGASLVSYAKVGAAPNYVLEPLAAAALWSADTLGRLLREMRSAECGMRISELRIKAARMGVWGFCALLAVHALQMNDRARLRWGPAPGAADRDAGRKLLARVRAVPGDIFCEDPVYAMLAGKAVLWQPFIMSQLAREGKWDERPVLEWLRGGKLELLAVGEDLGADGGREYERYTKAMAQAIRDRYQSEGMLVLPGTSKVYYIWRPK